MGIPRGLLGRHPTDGVFGLWFTYSGNNVFTADRTDRKKFAFSTSFGDQVPFRVIKSGFINTNTFFNLPGTFAQLGGEPLLAFRPMVGSSSTKERRNGFRGIVENNGGVSQVGAYSEFYGFITTGVNANTDPARGIIRETLAQTSTATVMRYLVALY